MSIESQLLRGASLVTLFGSALLFVYPIARTPPIARNMHGIRGARRQRALRTSPVFAEFEPLIRWLGTRMRALLPVRSERALSRQLMLAGDFLGLVPEEFVSLSVLACVGGAAAGALYAALLGKSALYTVFTGLLAAALPTLELSGREHERRRRVGNALPHAVDLIVLGLSAGLDFPGALRQLVEKSSSPDDPLIEEFSFVLQSLELGKTRQESLSEFAERLPNEAVREFAFAIIQAEERGNPLAGVLAIQAEVSRQRRSQRAEEAAARASVKLIAPLVLMFAAILLLMVAPMVFELNRTFIAD